MIYLSKLSWNCISMAYLWFVQLLLPQHLFWAFFGFGSWWVLWGFSDVTVVGWLHEQFSDDCLLSRKGAFLGGRRVSTSLTDLFKVCWPEDGELLAPATLTWLELLLCGSLELLKLFLLLTDMVTVPLAFLPEDFLDRVTFGCEAAKMEGGCCANCFDEANCCRTLCLLFSVLYSM